MSLTRGPARSPQSRRTLRRWSMCIALQSTASVESPGTTLFRQDLSDVKTEAQRLGHKMYNTIIERADIKTGWFEGGRIFSERSPEVIAFREKLSAKGKHLPIGTKLCIHAQKILVPNEKGTEEGENFTIKVTTQGTVTDRNFHNTLMTYIKEDFQIDDRRVEEADVHHRHEHDHVFGTKIADVADLRHPNYRSDSALTVKQTKKVHALRIAHYADLKPTYKLTNLTQPLSEVVKPMQKGDRDLWMDKNHRNTILEAGVTPKFLRDQYADAHKHEVSRMAQDLVTKKLHTRQATAYVTDAFLH